MKLVKDEIFCELNIDWAEILEYLDAWIKIKEEMFGAIYDLTWMFIGLQILRKENDNENNG